MLHYIVWHNVVHNATKADNSAEGEGGRGGEHGGYMIIRVKAPVPTIDTCCAAGSSYTFGLSRPRRPAQAGSEKSMRPQY